MRQRGLHRRLLVMLSLSLRACSALLGGGLPILNASPAILGGLSKCLPRATPAPRPPHTKPQLGLKGGSWFDNLFRPRGAARGGVAGLRASSTAAEKATPPPTPTTQLPEGYRMPPPELASLIQAEPPPRMLLSPPASGSKFYARTRRDPMLTLCSLAEPEEKLAGLRFVPHLDVASRQIRSHTLSIVERATNEEFEVQGTPPGAYISGESWSPDGKLLAFLCLTNESGLQVYTLDPARAPRVAKLASKRRLSTVLNGAYTWVDGGRLLVNAVPEGRGGPPGKPSVPQAPITEATSGTTAPARTYQDLLRTAHDEALFEHYTTTQLVEVSLGGGGGGGA